MTEPSGVAAETDQSDPSDQERERLRRTFTEDAGLYDRMRPGYPPRVYDDLADLAGAGPGCRVLEVGAGTGKATVPLAGRGCRIVAVELGRAMAAVARRRLAGHPDAEVVVAEFETWPLPPLPFDLVLAATSWHWIAPRVRVAKAAAALRPGGSLATVSTHHIKGGTEPFFAASQRCYEHFDPTTPPDITLRPASEIPQDEEELVTSGRFEPAVFRRYEWDATYTTQQYLDLLSTYSGHRDLAPVARAGLYESLAGLVDGRHGGRITKRHMTELRPARVLE
ncbi:methyltransferase domain-containing protein [Streptomyces sp. NPDC050264]|uniref:class I SAM-dependent methyltransferase n=1 Tax=Streptomyces sp. NPDC050264 TaxID=3155038 RepID=UPI003421FED9